MMHFETTGGPGDRAMTLEDLADYYDDECQHDGVECEANTGEDACICECPACSDARLDATNELPDEDTSVHAERHGNETRDDDTERYDSPWR